MKLVRHAQDEGAAAVLEAALRVPPLEEPAEPWVSSLEVRALRRA